MSNILSNEISFIWDRVLFIKPYVKLLNSVYLISYTIPVCLFLILDHELGVKITGLSKLTKKVDIGHE